MAHTNTTTRRTVVKTGAKLAYAAPLVATTMKLSAQGTLADASGADCLGSVWTESESGWSGTWTRVVGNAFSAHWTNPCCADVTADLMISVECVVGGAVSVIRTNSSDGNDCTYTGTYDGVNAVSGTYVCDSGGPYTWSATIS